MERTGELGDGGYAITVASGSVETRNLQQATIAGTKIKDIHDNDVTLNDFGNTPLSHINRQPLLGREEVRQHRRDEGYFDHLRRRAQRVARRRGQHRSGYRSPLLTLDQSSLVCTITFIDP